MKEQMKKKIDVKTKQNGEIKKTYFSHFCDAYESSLLQIIY
jgi:hypothetical protein